MIYQQKEKQKLLNNLNRNIIIKNLKYQILMIMDNRKKEIGKNIMKNNYQNLNLYILIQLIMN